MKHKSLTAAMAVLGVTLALSVWGDSSGLSISDAFITLIDNTSGTLNFPIARAGDTSFDAFLQYQTLDGTAVAGVNYIAASGSILIPAGQTSATIPVTIIGSGSNQPDKTFQMTLLGAGGGSFAPSFAAKHQITGAAFSPTSVKVADLNGDGLPDVIVADVGLSATAVSVFRNTTAPGALTPTFAPRQTFSTGSVETSVAVADINGDGKPDLIVTNEATNMVSVLLNTTAPGATIFSFATHQDFATGAAPLAVTVADVNGDGKPDLIVSNGNEETVSVLLNTTTPGALTPSFAAEQTFPVGEESTSVTTADLNGDGRPDIIVSNQFDSNVSVLINTTAPGAVTPSFATQQTFPTGIDPRSVTAADVNGDGVPDLIVANGNDKTVSVLLNTTAPGAGSASFANQQTFAAGAQAFSVTAADVNGDGRPDLIVANTGDNTVSVLLNATAPGAGSASFIPQLTFATGSQPFSVTAADLNGDGKLDVLTANDNDASVSVLINTTPTPATTFDGNSFAAQQTFTTGAGPRSVTRADINGDGKPDLIVANQDGDTVSVLLNTTAPGASSPSFGTHHDFGTGAGPVSVTAVDVNGDGKPDLITANNAGTVSVLLNTTALGSATPSFATQQPFNVGILPFSVTTADVNGDGLPDLIVANLNGNTVSVLLNTTAPGAVTPSFAAQQPFNTGTSPISVTAADVNGDGLPDVIVANESDHTVSVLLNTTAPGAITPSFAAQQTFATGSGPFSVTAVDLNGDGKPDLVVPNLNDETVSVLLNTTAPGAMTPSFADQQTFATGINPFSVTAVDLNGDGLPDLIVTNDHSNTVSVLLNTTAPGASTPSFATQQAFATGGEPRSVTAVDVNGDGKLDLIVADQNDNTVSVLLNSLYAAAASGSPVTGTIHYTVPPPPPTTIAVPTTLGMGTYPVGNTVVKNLTVKNTGTHPLFVGDVTSNSPEFAATGTTTCPGGGLAPAATCTIAIGFTPSTLGVRSGTISVNDNTPTSPQHVAVSGTGTVDMTVAPTSWGFGTVMDGMKKTKGITVHNFQHQSVSLSEGFTGANASDFSVTGGTCTATLGAASACSLNVTFAPTAIGTESATMTVTDSPDTLGPYMVTFTASATIPESISVKTIHYGNVAQTASKALSITVTNNATSGPITLTGTNIGGASPGDFAVTGGSCPQPSGMLGASSSCTYAVTFTPSTETAESGTLSIGVAEDPNGGPAAVGLFGTGVTPLKAVPLTGLDFGTVAGGHSSIVKTVSVYNSGGAAVTISESVTGINPGDFAVTGGTCTTLPGGSLAGGGAHCTYLIKFTPSIVGAESATIGVSGVGDAASPHNVNLTGTGS